MGVATPAVATGNNRVYGAAVRRAAMWVRASSRALLCGLAVASLAACELGANYGELGEHLLDPDVQGLDAPGERWVEGAHYDLNVLTDASGKRFAVARNAQGELTVIDFESRNFCRAGAVVRYDAAVIARSQQALIPVLVERPGPEGEPPGLDLTFSTFDCQRSTFRVPVGGMPNRVVDGLRSGSGTGLLVKSPDGGLLLVDPWAQTSTPLAESVRNDDPAAAFGYFLWVDRGVIVLSDERLEPVAFVGRNVVAVSISPEDQQLAYIEAGDGSVPGGTLYTVDARGAQGVQIGDHARQDNVFHAPPAG